MDPSREKRSLDTGRIHHFAAFAIMPHPFQIIQGTKAIMIGDQYAVRTIPTDDAGPAHRERDGLIGLPWKEDTLVVRVTRSDDLTCFAMDYRFVRGAGLPNFAS